MTAWYQAIAATGFLAQRATLVRQQLQALGDQVLALLARADADPQQADQLGVQLARLGYLNADALGRTPPAAVFRPVGWTPDNRRVVYTRWPRLHLIDWMYPPWQLFPVPQPILLIEVPEEYWE